MLHTAVNSLLGGVGADAQPESMQHMFKQTERPHLTVLFHGSEVHICCIRHDTRPIRSTATLTRSSFVYKAMTAQPSRRRGAELTITLTAQPSRPFSIKVGRCLMHLGRLS